MGMVSGIQDPEPPCAAAVYSVLVPGTWFYGFVFAETCGDNKISIARISQLVAQLSIFSEFSLGQVAGAGGGRGAGVPGEPPARGLAWSLGDQRGRRAGGGAEGVLGREACARVRADEEAGGDHSR